MRGKGGLNMPEDDIYIYITTKENTAILSKIWNNLQYRLSRET